MEDGFVLGYTFDELRSNGAWAVDNSGDGEWIGCQRRGTGHIQYSDGIISDEI
jgi:hypothetical protein